MKILITLAILLFVYPWSDSNKNSDKLLFKGMYTITGRGYNDSGEFDTATGCQAMHFEVHEKKMIVTMSQYGTGQYIEVEYPLVSVDNNGYRTYRKDDYDAFVVDNENNLQRILSSYTYNGKKRLDSHWELIKGDFSKDCLEKMEKALEWERKKSTMDLNGWY